MSIFGDLALLTITSDQSDAYLVNCDCLRICGNFKEDAYDK